MVLLKPCNQILRSVWTETTRTFNEIGATTNGVVLKDFKFVISNGTGDYFLIISTLSHLVQPI